MTTPPTDDLRARLLACPFCGGVAERIDFGPGSGDNEGGSCIACTKCQASGPVEFGYKENFVSNWNRRAALSALPAGGEEVGEVLWSTRNVADRFLHAFVHDVPLPEGTKLYTTPPPDAAVGAQGEGCTIRLAADDWNPYELLDIARLYVENASGLEAGDELFIERIRECLRQQKRTQAASPVAEGCSKCGSEWPASECACSCRAAPAAGKGVDELPTKWRKDADSLEDHARQIREQELSREVELLMARAATKRMDADALEAALTRQPVAEKSALDHYCDGTGFIGP